MLLSLTVLWVDQTQLDNSAAGLSESLMQLESEDGWDCIQLEAPSHSIQSGGLSTPCGLSSMEAEFLTDGSSLTRTGILRIRCSQSFKVRTWNGQVLLWHFCWINSLGMNSRGRVIDPASWCEERKGFMVIFNSMCSYSVWWLEKRRTARPFSKFTVEE